MSFLAVLLAALAAGNPIPAENAQQGTTEWAGPDVRGTAIQGYSSEVSVAPGGTIHFHISTQPAEAYNIHVFRLGWYGGLGGRLLACFPRTAARCPTARRIRHRGAAGQVPDGRCRTN